MPSNGGCNVQIGGVAMRLGNSCDSSDYNEVSAEEEYKQ